MPIREESFRIGCGRYLQGKNIISKLGAEIIRHGRSPIIVGGRTALGLTEKAITESISSHCEKYKIIEHTGTCNEESAKQLAELMSAESYDVVVGVGGGVIMDFAKLCGYYAKRPVINVPTSSATCAAYTPLSVKYTPDGKTVGSLHYDYEVDAVLADTEVLAGQPIRLLLAGVFDALSKFIEIKQRFGEEDGTAYPLGLDYAYMMSKHSFNILTKDTENCIADMKNGLITPRLENLIFTSIAATGVISGIARGSNQTALAHKFYETTRFLFPETARPYLHGEIVGVGLMLQNHFNGEEKNNNALTALIKKYGMPHSITDIGITSSPEIKAEYFAKLCASSAIDENNTHECKKLGEALDYLWGVV